MPFTRAIGDNLSRLTYRRWCCPLVLQTLESLDNGKPFMHALGDMKGVEKSLRFNAGAADKLRGDTIPIGTSHAHTPTLQLLLTCNVWELNIYMLLSRFRCTCHMFVIKVNRPT